MFNLYCNKEILNLNKNSANALESLSKKSFSKEDVVMELGGFFVTGLLYSVVGVACFYCTPLFAVYELLINFSPENSLFVLFFSPLCNFVTIVVGLMTAVASLYLLADYLLFGTLPSSKSNAEHHENIDQVDTTVVDDVVVEIVPVM